MKTHVAPFSGVKRPIAEVLANPNLLPFISEYRTLTAINHHLQYCFDEIVRCKGFLGQVVLNTRIHISGETAILISSLPNGSEMFVQVESSVRE